MSKKITVRTKRKNKKNFLKENYGNSATPAVQIAYQAGRDDAIAEIMEMVTGMISGAVPLDMGVPIELAQVSQLEEEAEPLEKLAKGIEKRGTEGDFAEWCGGEVTQACINRAAKEGGKRAKQASLAVTFSKAKGGGPTLTYPKKNK